MAISCVYYYFLIIVLYHHKCSRPQKLFNTHSQQHLRSSLLSMQKNKTNKCTERHNFEVSQWAVQQWRLQHDKFLHTTRQTLRFSQEEVMVPSGTCSTHELTVQLVFTGDIWNHHARSPHLRFAGENSIHSWEGMGVQVDEEGQLDNSTIVRTSSQSRREYMLINFCCGIHTFFFPFTCDKGGSAYNSVIAKLAHTSAV